MVDGEEQIAVVGRTIRCRSCGEEWTIEIDDLRLIGEETTDQGPFAIDYFIAFYANDRWRFISWYADGRDEAVRAMESLLGFELKFELVFSTSCVSRAIWPPSLAGRAFYREESGGGGSHGTYFVPRT
ncbi:MAG TPA: hypothetical protein VGN57_11495 [Pirellulaceae bacterium]|jgi:hypothetical protein|nr:hypothetical protein [Pirellulaceae bacterium]